MTDQHFAPGPERKVVDLLAALEASVLDARAARDRITQRCSTCGAKRPRSDMGHVNGAPFCHPFDSEGTTCFMAAQSLMGERDVH